MIAVSIAIIILIESSGNPGAVNGQAKGLMQITPVVLKEYNKFNPDGHAFNTMDYELLNASINKRIGTWYLNHRIPQMLRAKKKPVTVKNILIAWNAGIKYVGKDNLPLETRNYLTKYARERRYNAKKSYWISTPSPHPY